MHIAINALLVSGAFSGVQQAIVQQLRALLDLDTTASFTVIVPRDTSIAAQLGTTRRPYRILHVPVSGHERLRRILWEQACLPDVLAQAGVDLLYAPGYLMPLRWQGPSVVFIHDTIALAHPRLCRMSNAVNYRLLLPLSARRASLVAVPSRATAEDVVRDCRLPATRIRRVPLGVEIPPPPTAEQRAAACARLGVAEPFLLAVSTIEPKKNFAALIRWFDGWKQAGIPHRLVIAGQRGWGCDAVDRAWAQSPFRNEIHLPGYLPAAELPAVMAAAALLLLPSRYEGFGLPALEAMAVGTPVVVSDRGALPETVGNAGVVLPLEDARWLADIPALLRDDDRLAVLRAAGHARAACMSWRQTAETLMEIFTEAVKNN